MRRWSTGVFMLLCLFGLGGLVLAQQARPANPFVTHTVIAASELAANFVVEPVYDRLIAAAARTVTIRDGQTFALQRVIQRSVTLNASAISHNARMIALAAGRVIELWDIETGELITSIEPPGANFVTAPLMFSDDDSYLLFTANVPASQATRRSENDTDLLTWVWDVSAARRLGSSRLPGRVRAYSFFDYRTGNVYMLPNNRILAAAAGRFDVIELGGAGLAPTASIQASRFENDPVALWFSAYDDAVYARTSASSSGEIRALYRDTPRAAQSIGDVNSRVVNPLLRTLYGYDYRADYNYHPLTVHLDDVLLPVTQAARQPLLRLAVHDHETGMTQFENITLAGRYQVALDELRRRVALREQTGDNAVTIYDLASGQPEARFIPAQRADETRLPPLAFTGRGEALIVGEARYDARSGEPLIEGRAGVPSFDRHFFSQDSRHLITVSGSIWQVWDVDDGGLLRREIIQIGSNSSLDRFSTDGSRLLLDTARDDRTGVTVYDVAGDTRRTVLFEPLPGMSYRGYTPNPDWTYFAVRYNAAPGTVDAPAGAVMLYSLSGEAAPILIAGADLPADPDTPFWVDADTLAITGRNVPTAARVFGAEYAPVGAPACLLARFPESADVWAMLWENLAFYRDGSALARLSIEVCAAADADSVVRLLTPTPPSTPIPQATAAISRIAGVPVCLTQGFPDQAVAYAREWRRLTDGLPAEQVELLTTLMCEGLRGRFAGGYVPGASGAPREQVTMLIDARTGRRTVLSGVLPRSADPNGAAVPYLEGLYRRVFNNQRSLANPILSPDQRYVAENRGTEIVVYRLEPPFPVLAQEATATAVGTIGAQPRVIRVQPTATPPPEQLGLPRPTLTPTIVPTLIPLVAQDEVFLPLRDRVTEMCPHAQPIAWEDRPDTFTPTGRLLGAVHGVRISAALNPATRALTLDETIPPCMFGVPCIYFNYNLDRTWIIDERSGIHVMRPDGRDAVTLFTETDMPTVQDVRWANRDQVRIQRLVYVDGEREPTTRVQFYTPRDRLLSVLEPPEPELGNINGLPASVIATSPNGGELMIAMVVRPRPDGQGMRYYVVNRRTQAAQVLFETEPGETASFTWQPYGEYISIYYSARPDRLWRLYEAEPGVLLDDPIPPASYSRDGRLRLSAFQLSFEESEARAARGEPLPTLRLIDDVTGEVRLYCPPSAWFSMSNSPPVWSEDGRYLALSAAQPNAPRGQSRSYFTVYILDIQTGVVVDMRADMTLLTDWLQEVQ